MFVNDMEWWLRHIISYWDIRMYIIWGFNLYEEVSWLYLYIGFI